MLDRRGAARFRGKTDPGTKPPTEIDPGRRRIERPDRNRVASSEKGVFVVAPIETEPEGRQICPSRADDRRAVRLQTPYRASAREREMDPWIQAKFGRDRHVLGPFLGNLPPEILDVVVGKLGWFQTTFAMAGRTCREAVERVASARGAHGGRAEAFVLGGDDSALSV